MTGTNFEIYIYALDGNKEWVWLKVGVETDACRAVEACKVAAKRSGIAKVLKVTEEQVFITGGPSHNNARRVDRIYRPMPPEIKELMDKYLK